MKPSDLKRSKFLIHYDELVKPSGLFILRIIRDKYAKNFSKLINIQSISSISDQELELMYVSRNIINPLEWLKISDFDTEANYKYFYEKYKNMYISTRSFDISKAINNFINAYFIDHVYFYSETYDKRIDFDIAALKNETSNDNKVSYIVGDLNSVIDEVSPNVIFHPYLNQIYENTIKTHREIIFSIPTFGYNFNENSVVNKFTDNDSNIGFYPIIQLDKPIYFG